MNWNLKLFLMMSVISEEFRWFRFQSASEILKERERRYESKKITSNWLCFSFGGLWPYGWNIHSDLSSCLTQKAYAALADGTLANSEVMPLAKKIAGQCIQQLALAGMDTEAINASKTLLTVLKENTVATTK